MRVFRCGRFGLAIAIYAALCICAAPGQVLPVPTAPQAIPVLPDQTPVSPPQTLPGGPDVPSKTQDQTANQDQNSKSQVDSRGKRPLTPAEIREREIEKYDPLSRTNPASHPEETPASASSNASDEASGTSGASSPQEAPATPLPGSVAESNEGNNRDPNNRNPNDAGPQVASESGDSLAGPQYNGPAVLSRDYTLARPMASKEVKWSWTIGSAESWQSGLVTGSATPGTASTNGTAFGSSTTFSFNGRHFWKQDEIGIDYGASYSMYSGASSYNGTNQRLNLDYKHQFSRRLSFNLIENGSINSANYTLQNPLTAPGVSMANVDLAASPLTQVLDQTVRQFFTSAGVTFQESTRLSFSLTGGFFAVQLTGPQLIGNVGYQAKADVNYRYTKKATVGAYYSYNSYVYDKHVAVSNSDTVGLIYSYAFNLSTQLRLRAGLSWVETLAYTQVPIDPAFAVLVGQSYGIVDLDNKSSTSDLSAQFVKDFRHSGTVSASFARGIAPGNGLILTAVQETATLSFATTFFRRYNLSLTGGRSALTSEAQNTGSYTSNFVGLNFSRALPHGATSNLSANYDKYSITNSPGLHSQFIVTSGVTWGPGPGRLW